MSTHFLRSTLRNYTGNNEVGTKLRQEHGTLLDYLQAHRFKLQTHDDLTNINLPGRSNAVDKKFHIGFIKCNKIEYELFAYMDKICNQLYWGGIALPSIRIFGIKNSHDPVFFKQEDVLAVADLRGELKLYDSKALSHLFAAHLRYIFIYHGANVVGEISKSFNDSLKKACLLCQDSEGCDAADEIVAEESLTPIKEEEHETTQQAIHLKSKFQDTEEAVDYWHMRNDECNDLLSKLENKKSTIQAEYQTARDEARCLYDLARAAAKEKRKEDTELMQHEKIAVLASIRGIKADMKRKVDRFSAEDLLQVMQKEIKHRRID